MDDAGSYRKREDGRWELRPPGAPVHVPLHPRHEVIEHDDGTISVTPSLLWRSADPGTYSWHGHLRRGVYTPLRGLIV